MWVEIKRPMEFVVTSDKKDVKRRVEVGIHDIPKNYAVLAISEKWAVDVPKLITIRNSADYKEAMRQIDLLRDAKPNTAEERELFRMTKLVCTYCNIRGIDFRQPPWRQIV